METSRNLVIRSKLVIRSSSVIGSNIGVVSDQLRVRTFKTFMQLVVYTSYSKINFISYPDLVCTF